MSDKKAMFMFFALIISMIVVITLLNGVVKKVKNDNLNKLVDENGEAINLF